MLFFEKLISVGLKSQPRIQGVGLKSNSTRQRR